MAHVDRYRRIIRDKLCGLAKFINENTHTREFSAHAVIDEEHDQYLLVKTGWNGSRRVHGVTLYLRILEGKIWIEEGICGDLVEAGAAENISYWHFNRQSQNRWPTSESATRKSRPE